jgi:hypothetical protein
MMEGTTALGIDPSRFSRNIVQDPWHWRCETRDREIGLVI